MLPRTFGIGCGGGDKAGHLAQLPPAAGAHDDEITDGEIGKGCGVEMIEFPQVLKTDGHDLGRQSGVHSLHRHRLVYRVSTYEGQS